MQDIQRLDMIIVCIMHVADPLTFMQWQTRIDYYSSEFTVLSNAWL